jgi:hypothetical protein
MTSVMNVIETPKKSYSAKYYSYKIKTDAEFYEKEKKRVSDDIHNRYFNYPGYQKKILQQKKEYYLKKKQLKNA